MSKVYSFRLSDDNPREAQAREVIEAWVEEGYSLRYLIVEALTASKNGSIEHGELASVIGELQNMILSLDKQIQDQTSKTSLSNSFLVAVRNSAKGGVNIYKNEKLEL